MPNTYWQRFLTTEDRFWSKASRTPDTAACWMWQAAICKDGYGVFIIGSRRDKSRHCVRAHRFAYELTYGPIADGLVIDHLCRTPACVNPYHLEVVTVRENTLRGGTIQAKNSRKTHCKRGHLLEGDNVRLVYRKDRPGFVERHCRECRRFYTRQWNETHRELNRKRQAAYQLKKRAKQS